MKALVAARFPQVTLTSTGGPEVSAGNADRIKKDSILALALAALLICLVLWLSYKRLSDVLWILISIAAGALFALGIISLFKTSVSLIVLGIGCTIIGIAVNWAEGLALRHILCNAFGFGGNDSSLLFSAL